MILIRAGLRVTDALSLPRDCLVTDADGAPYLRYDADRDNLNGYVTDTVHNAKHQATALITLLAQDNDRVDDLDLS